MNLREKAQELASKGRFGDDRLLHVSEAELRGLASLIPGGLPINPKTGLPEAFFFLPFLFGAAPAAAATAAAAAPALAATTAAMGGLGAGAGAAGLGALTAGMQAGMGAAAGGLGSLASLGTAAGTTAATALPAATSLAPGLTALAPAAAETAAATAPAMSGLASIPGVGGTLTPALSGAGLTSASQGLSAGLPAFAAPTSGLPAVTPELVGAAPAVAEAPAAIAPAVSGAPSWAGTEVAPAALAPSAPAPAAPVTDMSSRALGGALDRASVPGYAGASPTQAAAAEGGGILGGMDMNKMLQYAAMGAMLMPKGGGKKKDEEGPDVSKVKYKGGEPTFPGSDFEGGIDPEWKYFNPKYDYAEGGLTQLLPPESAPPPPKGDDELIEATVAALQGKVPNPQEIIQQFIATFGQAALQDLMAKLGMGGGMAAAPSQAPQGDGMSDGIPALLQGQNGQQAPARLSEGEFVVPADVVSGLGNGSTNAGAGALEQMNQRVRAYKNGGQVKQPPAVNPNRMMPY